MDTSQRAAYTHTLPAIGDKIARGRGISTHTHIHTLTHTYIHTYTH
jgi:hypothetical protein